MENTNIYICTHKDFSVPQDLKGNYKIITDGTELTQQYPYPVTNADNELIPMKHCYSEGVMLYDIWKKDTTSQYIGINHYRRYLQSQFFDGEDENVLPIPMAFNLYAQYAGCHNILDLLECKEIIEKYYSNYSTNVVGFSPCNMAILEHSIYDEWCEFMFGVLEIFNERKKLYTDEDVRNYVGKYFPEDKIDYQSRLNAFLMERISTIYFANKFDGQKIRRSQIIMTNG